MTAFAGLLSLAVAVVVAGAAAIGPGVFTLVVTLLAAAVLLDLSGQLGAASQRPVVPAAAIAAVILPIVMALDPARGWARLGLGVALTLLAAFLLLLVSPRRRGITEALGATALAGLVVGLGAASLVLLRAEPEGVRWIVGLVALAAAVDIGGIIALLMRGRGGGEVAAPPPSARPGGGLRFVATASAVGVVGVVLIALVNQPFGPNITLLLALLTVGLGTLAAELVRLLHAAAGIDPGRRRPARLGDGRLIAATTTLLLTAPAVALIVRSTA